MERKFPEELNADLVALFPKMFKINEVLNGKIADIGEETILVQFDNGAFGRLFKRNFDPNNEAFVIDAKVEVKIADFKFDGSMFLALTENFRHSIGLEIPEYQGIVRALSSNSIAVYFPDLNKLGLKMLQNIDELENAAILKPGSEIKCRLLRFTDKVIIDHILD